MAVLAERRAGEFVRLSRPSTSSSRAFPSAIELAEEPGIAKTSLLRRLANA